MGTPATEADLRWKNASLSALSLSLKRHANRWVVRSAFNPAPPFALNGTNEALLRLCDAADARVTAALRDPRERRWRRVAEDAIGDRYAQSNALTAGLTGLDLRAFGYTCAPTGTG